MQRDDIAPVRISGKILMSDGSETEFSIEGDLGWQQWGNITEKLGATVDLMDALSEAAGEHLRDPEDVQDDVTEAGDYTDPGSKWNVEADMLDDAERE